MPKLLEGAKLSSLVSASSVTAGICLGITIACARLSKVKLFKSIAGAYVAFVRGTPMIANHDCPLRFDGIRFDPCLHWLSGIVALSLNSGAYMGEGSAAVSSPSISAKPRLACLWG